MKLHIPQVSSTGLTEKCAKASCNVRKKSYTCAYAQVLRLSKKLVRQWNILNCSFASNRDRCVYMYTLYARHNKNVLMSAIRIVHVWYLWQVLGDRTTDTSTTCRRDTSPTRLPTSAALRLAQHSPALRHRKSRTF